MEPTQDPQISKIIFGGSGGGPWALELGEHPEGEELASIRRASQNDLASSDREGQVERECSATDHYIRPSQLVGQAGSV